jgi:hypothetical protein
MKLKIILFIVFLCTFSFVFCQDEDDKLSFNFSNLSLKETLLNIEKKTDYKFSFAETWISEITITKTYTDVSIDNMLSDIFNNTALNYYILPNEQVVITQNSIIYDELPSNYFGDERQSTEAVVTKDTSRVNTPIFINRNNQSIAKTKTVRIGKERRGFTKKAYTLSGYVYDADTGQPTSNLALVVKSSNLGTVTESNGYYEIKLPAGVNILETSGLGTEKRQTRIVIYEDGTLNLNLRSQFEELSEVVLQNQGVKNVEDTNVGRTQITTEDSKNIPLVLGERDVLKVATLQPGITTAGEGATGFNVRGGKTDQNLILLEDGVIYNPSHFFGIFQALNPLVVSSVNIYKGNIPAEFGGRISSVFDIETKDADKNKFGTDISVGPVTANVVVETPIVKEKSGLLIGARGTHSDWVLNSLNEADLENSEASFYDFIVKYNHKINDKNEVQALGYYSRDQFSITSDSLFGYSNRLVSLKWQHKFNDKNDATLILSNSQYKFNIDYENTMNDNFAQSFQINETALKLKVDYALNKKHSVSYGLSGKLYGIFPGDIEPQGQNNQITPVSLPKEQGVEGGVFIADRYKVNDKLLLDFGLRLSFFAALGEADKRVYSEGTPRSETTVIDTVSFGANEVIKTYGGPEFRLAARYLLSDELSIKASANNTFQYIHTLSNNTTVSPIDIWKLSDNFIEPQQATQVSLGLFKNFNVNAYELSLEGFYKWQKNTLDFKTGADIQLNEAIETEVLQGSGRAYGVELLLKKNRGDLSGWIGYTYSRSFFKLDSQFLEERVNDGEFFPSNYDKPHDVSLVLNYKLSQRISVSSNFLYQTGRPVTFPTGNFQFNGGEFVQYSDRNQFRIPDYYRLDLGFNFEGNHKKNKLAHSFWSLSVYNVLGRNNPYSVFFVNEDGDIKALQSSIFNIPVPSITYNISF